MVQTQIERSMQIAVLIPTFKRVAKLKPLLENFTKFSTQSNLYFLIEPTDTETITALNALKSSFKFEVFEVAGEYVKAINYGYKNTSEPFIFCGADDIFFTQGWEDKLLGVMKDEKINVTGGVDDWACSQTGVHISHPLLRRSYCQTQGASWGGNTEELYYSGYRHYQCDIEMENLALTRGCLKVCKDCTIEHIHFVNGKAPHDFTYDNSKNNCFAHDTEVYTQRCPAFEAYDRIEVTAHGRATPSKYQREKLSIVMPIWNCKDVTLQTLRSVITKTKNKWQLILIDDKSTEFDGVELLREMRQQAYQGGFTDVIVHQNDKQEFCNGSWNIGVRAAAGDYICVINNDIEFDNQNWDELLIEKAKEGYELVNPFERNRVYPEPYQQVPLPSPVHHLNIRGCCFLMVKELAKRVFPINNARYKHWCGDNMISNAAKTWTFDRRVVVNHYLSKSSAKVDPYAYTLMTQSDIVNYMIDNKDYCLIKLIRDGVNITIESGAPKL